MSEQRFGAGGIPLRPLVAEVEEEPKVEDTVTEDLRDYLRRRGIKIYTDKPFKSMTIPYMETL